MLSKEINTYILYYHFKSGLSANVISITKWCIYYTQQAAHVLYLASILSAIRASRCWFLPFRAPQFATLYPVSVSLKT